MAAKGSKSIKRVLDGQTGMTGIRGIRAPSGQGLGVDRHKKEP